MSTDPSIKLAGANGLLTRKLLVAFAIGFVPPAALALFGFMESLIEALSTGGDINIRFLGALLLAGILGALTAGGRALLALGPWNIAGPTDALHTIGSGDKPSTIVVDENPGAIEVDDVEA